MQAEMDCLDALKRLGQHLEDGHWFFDIILDEQLMERAGDYDVLVLPEIQRLSAAEGERLEEFVGRPRLVTDAPWFVRVRAWCPQDEDAVVIHWINYRQDEEAAIEIPLPIGLLQAECEIPDGLQVERVEWHYPEMREPVALEHEKSGSNVRFTIPCLIVYGMSVLYLQANTARRGC